MQVRNVAHFDLDSSHFKLLKPRRQSETSYTDTAIVVDLQGSQYFQIARVMCVVKGIGYLQFYSIVS